MIKFTAIAEVALFGGITPALKVGRYWLDGKYTAVNSALWREGQTIEVEAYPDDQFCREIIKTSCQ